MSHTIHHTEGFILGSKNTGEANRYFSIYTKDLGLIRASAQSVRKLESKLRFHLQDYFLIKLDLVEGREIWRITNAEKIKSIDKIWANEGINNFIKNISKLLLRLCSGEEKNEDLFNELKQLYMTLENEEFSADELLNFECVSVLRILYSLGYIGNREALEKFIVSPLDRSVLKDAGLVRRDLIKEINTSLRESHL